ncbi:MAG TPA: RDD family protein [Acidimicrobiales bacterium]
MGAATVQSDPGRPVAADGIVTPEAVLLELDLASVASRALAQVVDLVAKLGFVMIAALAVAWLGDSGVAYAVMAFSVFGVLIVYPCAFEVLARGRTPGKMALGLRVVTAQGAPLSFRHGAIRAMVGLVDFLVPPGGATAVLSCLASARSQRLGDLVAGTVVLHERANLRTATTALWFVLPPGWEPYAASIDTASVTADQYRLARSYLLRSNQLSLDARYQIGNTIAGSLARQVRHLRPPTVSAEQFILAVVASYQRRHFGAQPGAAPRDGTTWTIPTLPPSPPAVAGGFTAPD